MRRTLPQVAARRFPWPDWLAGVSRIAAGWWPPWLLALVAVAGVSAAAGTSFNTNLSLPGTDSQAAASLLTHELPGRGG